MKPLQLALALSLAALLFGCGSPRSRPPLPAPDLAAKVDALGARLAYGRERVAFYLGAAHVDGIARLHLSSQYGPDRFRRASRSAARVPGLVSRPRYQADHAERPTSRCSSAQSPSDGGRRPARTPRVAGPGARLEASQHRSTCSTAPAVPATHVGRDAEGSSDGGSIPPGSTEFAPPTGAASTGGRRPEVSASAPPGPTGANIDLEPTRNGRRGARFEAVVGSVLSFTVGSGPGAADASRRGSLSRGRP
jgi:hypothetical protein